MRKLAGTITPCQSKAAATRLSRSPPAATKVATTSTATSARTANGIAQRQPRHRRAGLERLGRAQRALDMGAPQRDRKGILGRGGDLVGDRGRRPMRQAGIAVEPPEAVDLAGHAHHEQRRERRGGEQEEGTETDRPPDRRQPEPEPEPRQRQEQADHGRDRGQRRPQPLPEDRPARPAQRPRQHVVAGAIRRGNLASGRPADRSVK